MKATENRKNYTVSLNPEDTERAKEKLEKVGMSLSGFVRGAIHEFLETIELGEKKKGFKDMSASEFLTAVEEMKKRLEEK